MKPSVPRGAGLGGTPLPRISVVVPALDEEVGIAQVLREIPRELVGETVVVDNGSRDRTGEVALRAGARVVREPRRGYGQACLAGLRACNRPDVVVFLDADHSDHPEEMGKVLEPILRGEADLVIGSRSLGGDARRSLTPQAFYGNRFACFWIRLLFGRPCSDLGPFRAIRREALERLGMRDRGFGWTAEMQVRAAILGLRMVEVSVRYRRRTGRSKISGTLLGTVRAGWKILYTIFSLRVRSWVSR